VHVDGSTQSLSLEQQPGRRPNWQVRSLQVSTVQGSPSSQSLAPLQQLGTPVWVHRGGVPVQASTVQAFPSSQSCAETQQPESVWVLQILLTRSQASSVQGSPSSQSTEVEQIRQVEEGVPVQRPAWQASAVVQESPSEQAAPSFPAEWVHSPVVGSHPSVVHGFRSSQASGVPERQLPAWQLSMPLQGLPSEHEVPAGTGAWAQPLTASQVSAVQGFASSHTGGVPGWQAPARQVSRPLHTVASSHGVPSVTGACAHPFGLQVSVVHGLLSLQSAFEVQETQLGTVWPVHWPLWQASPVVQLLPSSQAVPFGWLLWTQLPVVGSHESAVQGF
jgi:hypothetical protein